MKYLLIVIAVVVLAFGVLLLMTGNTGELKVEGEVDMKSPEVVPQTPESSLKTIYLAGGCFWGVEEYMDRVYGVVDSESGYANGKWENPSYEDLIYKNSGHAETVKITYDAAIVDLEVLLAHYFKIIDPTTLNRQGNDIGVQYRTGVYYESEADREIIEDFIRLEEAAYEDPILVEVVPLDGYYPAEDYHQDYLKKNPGGYCHIDLSKSVEVVIPMSKYPRPQDEVIKEKLSELSYNVTQLDATERAFTSGLYTNEARGIYVDIVTGEPLFTSFDKFESGSGWPSFVKPIAPEVLVEKSDTKLGYLRVEVRSRSGDSHLGHVFEDGPKDRGGLRYCINGAALEFVPLEEMVSRGYGYLMALFNEAE
ncbi:MAG: peptide methionine sulfoxide reductase [delta proteobacterium ML8_F1]|nr:MAG: peptide methionine sulfoxide reductase [delta proteobacterium ML8_F1]